MSLKIEFHFLVAYFVLHQSLQFVETFSRNCLYSNEDGEQILRFDDASRHFRVLCDQRQYNGGWTVILSRSDGSVDFSERTCQNYKFGFGNLSNEFFLGLDQLNALTSDENHMLLVLMTDFNDTEYVITYDTFIVWDETFEYSTGVTASRSRTGSDAGFTKWNAFCTACSKLRCLNDIPGWQLNPSLESEIITESVVQFFGVYPNFSGDIGRNKMGIYNLKRKRVYPMRSIKMMIRPFKEPSGFEGHSKSHARLDTRFVA